MTPAAIVSPKANGAPGWGSQGAGAGQRLVRSQVLSPAVVEAAGEWGNLIEPDLRPLLPSGFAVACPQEPFPVGFAVVASIDLFGLIPIALRGFPRSTRRGQAFHPPCPKPPCLILGWPPDCHLRLFGVFVYFPVSRPAFGLASFAAGRRWTKLPHRLVSGLLGQGSGQAFAVLKITSPSLEVVCVLVCGAGACIIFQRVRGRSRAKGQAFFLKRWL